jgi:hypothetical protein
MTLKVVPKAACDESEGKPEQKFDGAFGTLELVLISSCTKRKQKLYNYYLLES